MVLYRPRWDELEPTLRALASCRSEFELIWFLVSGTNSERDALKDLLRRVDLSESSRVVHRYDNLGFASGHNLLLRQAFAAGAGSGLVLNPDVIVAPGALSALRCDADGCGPEALVGPTLSAVGNGGKVFDSLGIRWSRTGRHFDARQGDTWSIQPGRMQSADGITGACLLVSRQAHDLLTAMTGNFFDDAFLAYREDAELGVRARAIGIPSWVAQIEGFSHPRHVKGFERGKALPDLLGVRNRFLMRFKLGRLRPGVAPLVLARDVLVVAGVLATERSSVPGMLEAWRLRRTLRNSGRRFRDPRGRPSRASHTGLERQSQPMESSQ